MKYPDTANREGTVVAVFFHIPLPRDEAIAEADAIVARINEVDTIEVKANGNTYYGFAEVRMTEDVLFDFNEDGDIIGQSPRG